MSADDDYDDNPYDDRGEPRRRPRRRRRRDDDYDRPHYEQAHRGGLILALGIIGLMSCAPVGVAAWLMGNTDLQAMDEGRMDPEGRQLTQVGKILGMVATLIMGLSVLAGIGIFGLMFLGVAAGA